MRHPITILVGLVLLLGARAADEALEEARAEAAKTLCVELLALAEACEEDKLFASREACLREVILLDPDNEDARAALGHKRQRDGSWKEPERRRAPRDLDAEAAAAFRARHAAAASGYCAVVLAAMEAADPPLAPERRRALREELLALAPEDPTVRAAFGEARLGEAWVLDETLAGKARRPVLKDIVRASYENAAPAREVPPTEREAALGLEWTAVLEVPGLRVLGTVPREELERAARALQAARSSFNGIFGADVDYYEGATVFLLDGGEDKQRFLVAHPGIADEYRAFLGRLECSGIQGTSDLAHWGKEPRLRLDGTVRIALGWLMFQAFGVTTETGWAFEGVGLYLARELIGTRLTWFVQSSSEYLSPNEELVLRRRLMRDDTNWMNEANQVLQGENAPRLQFVMGKTVNNMSPEDLLFSYVAVAYLLEGRPDEAPALLERVGSPVPSPRAVHEVLGLDVVDLDRRARRWLTERR